MGKKNQILPSTAIFACWSRLSLLCLCDLIGVAWVCFVEEEAKLGIPSHRLPSSPPRSLSLFVLWLVSFFLFVLQLLVIEIGNLKKGGNVLLYIRMIYYLNAHWLMNCVNPPYMIMGSKLVKEKVKIQ